MSDFAFDVIGLLDAVYAIDQPTEAWCEAIFDASTFLNQGAGLGMALYSVSREDCLEYATVVGHRVAQEWIQKGVEMHQDPALAGIIGRGYARIVTASTHEMLAGLQIRSSYLSAMKKCEIGDQWIMNGFNKGGAGAALYLFGTAEIAFGTAQRRMLEALAGHIGTAYRLRQRLAQQSVFETVEAILRPNGEIEHTTPATRDTDARHGLSEAVKRREWARARAGRDSPAKAMQALRGLVNATWTLVDWFDRDGKRYVVACRNLATDRGVAALSAREHQIAALAKQGRSNKEIAYELRLAHSTVRVIMARAAVKLGTQSRSELVREFARATTTS